MNGVAGLFDDKIVDEGAIGEDGLGTDAAAPLLKVCGPYLGDEVLHRPDESGLAEREIDFLEACAPIAGGHSPESGLGDYRPDLGGIYGGDGVAFPRAGDHGVGATADNAALDPSEGGPEKGKAGVWDGINEVADEGSGLGSERVELAAERNEAHIGPDAGHGSNAVGV